MRLKKPLSVFRTEIELSIMKMFLLLSFPLSHYLIKIPRKTPPSPEEETVNKAELLLKCPENRNAGLDIDTHKSRAITGPNSMQRKLQTQGVSVGIIFSMNLSPSLEILELLYYTKALCNKWLFSPHESPLSFPLCPAHTRGKSLFACKAWALGSSYYRPRKK